MRQDSNTAIVDFTAFDGEQLYAGISRVSAGHVYLRRHPNKFGPAAAAMESATYPQFMAEEKARRAALKPARPGRIAAQTLRPRKPSPWYLPTAGEPPLPPPVRFNTAHTTGRPPEVRKYNLSTPTVRFKLAATRALNAIPFTTAHEQGGGLYGYAVGHDIRVYDICTSATPVGTHSMTLDIDRMIDSVRGLPYALISTWHSHPAYHESGPQPSEPDRDSWSLCFENRRTGHDEAFVGLILGPRMPPEVDADPWYPPALGAWVTHAGSFGETVIDTAGLKWEFER